MSLPIPVATWLKWGQISQFLRSDAQQNRMAFNNGGPDNFMDVLLAIVNNSVQEQFNNNNNDPNLLITAPYLIALIGKYQIPARQIIANLASTLPVYTGPTSESTLVGTPVTFSVTLSAGTPPITYQWYRNGVLIAGATASSYTLSNPQLSDSGASFTVIVTGPAGSVPSGPATLTVTASIEGALYYTDTDPGPTIRGGSNPFSYQSTFAITHNQPFVITIPSAATPNKFLVIQAPSAESAKTIWANGTFNTGNIPDAIFQTPASVGGNTLYYTRTATTMDATQPLTLS